MRSSAVRRPLRWIGATATAVTAGLLLGCSSEPVVAGAGSAGAPASTPTESAPAGGVSPVSQSGPLPGIVPAQACEQQYLGKLNPREKLAQMLTVGVANAADARQVVSNYQVGGIFIGGWTDRGLVNGGALAEVKQQAKAPLMVTIDEEGGRVSRVGDLVGEMPAARVVADTLSPEQAYQQELDRARKLAGLGVTVDFAPVVDVSTQPADSVIGDRSFSGDPATVTRYASQYVRALHDGGLGAVLKHFPGHGSGSGDSHLGAVTTPPLDQLMRVDLQPYRDLVGSGAAVMVGHLDVPGLTAAGTPASISPEAMQLLRTGIGYLAAPFDGVIFTDDLSGMAAITDRMGVPAAVEAALVAGADDALWITTDAVPAVLDRLEQAVAAGRLTPERVDQSVLRIARFKNALHC